MNKKIRTGIVSTALVAGSLFGASVVNAQVDDTGTDTETQTEQPSDDEQSDREARRAERAERRAERAQATADLLGITPEELREAYQAGQTLADLADANGVDVQTIIDAKIAAKTERINTAVDEGRITAEEAAEKLDSVEERVTTKVNEGPGERGDRGNRGPRGDRGDRQAPAEQGACVRLPGDGPGNHSRA